MTQYYKFLEDLSFWEARAIAAFAGRAPGRVMLSGPDLPGHENAHI